MTVLQWWRGGSAPARLRRRLLVLSAPVTLILVVAIAKLVSVGVVGRSAADAFADRDAGALRQSVATLSALNVVEPARAPFAAGTLAVLDNRLEDAERDFAASLARADSCPARVNLELVRETLGDRAFTVLDGETAVARYFSARTVVEQDPNKCFAGNTDPDPQRRAVRDEALARLDGKIDAARVAPPPPPPPADAAAPPPPAPAGAGATDADRGLRLNPGAGDPLDRLRQILRDAAVG